MAQNVIINEITYQNVPEVNIPKVGGGTAKFVDTSDANLDSGSKMLAGTTGYGGDGTKYTGDIPEKDSTDLTASGPTVTVPPGHYAEAASKSIPNGSAATPATTINVTPNISVSESGLITASVSAQQSVTPAVSAGYIASGTAGNVSVSGSETEQLTTKAAATITPGTSDQSIPAGTYLTGAQTVKGDANLLAQFIKSGVSIFNVLGTLTSVAVSQDATTKVLSIS